MLSPFHIHQPATVEEASDLLARHGPDEAAVYAGGTELLLLLKEGLAHYRHLVDVKTSPGLAEISVDADQRSLRIGALVTHRQLICSPLVQEQAPLLREMEAQVANARVRAVGTIGGNLCFAEPHSDPATLLLAWEAELELASLKGRRTVPATAFFTGLLATDRRPEEILTGIRLPLLAPRTEGAYAKFGQHERPSASIAVLLRFDEGLIAEARIAVGSVGPMPMRAAAAEALLAGAPPSEAAFAAAATRAASAADVMDDLYGTPDYKRHLVRVLTGRALAVAAARAGRHVHVA